MYDAAVHDIHVLSGNAVTDARGNAMGKIEELMIDLQEGRVAYAVVSFDRIEELKGRLFAVPWEALTIERDRRAFRLELDRELLKDAPVFDREHAYPRMLWSPASLGKAPIGIVSGRTWLPGKKSRNKTKTNGTWDMALADTPFRVHR